MKNMLSLTCAALLCIIVWLCCTTYSAESDALQAQGCVNVLTSQLDAATAQTALLAAQLADKQYLPDGMAATYVGEFMLTSYCTEHYPHICGTGDGITASGAPVTPGLTVAADLSVLPLGTVVYISGVGVRIVQDTGGGLQGNHLDIAVAGTHEDALGWPLGGAVAEVWILGGVDNADA